MKNLLLATCSLLALTLACSFQRQVETTHSVRAVISTPAPQYAIVCMAGSLNFRSAPGTDEKVDFVFPDGTLIEVMDDTETAQDGALWRLTEFGWANARYLCLEAK